MCVAVFVYFCATLHRLGHIAGATCVYVCMSLALRENLGEGEQLQHEAKQSKLCCRMAFSDELK